MSSYGAVVSGRARAASSTAKAIEATGSSATAVTLTVPETVAPSAGRTSGQIFFGEFPLHWASSWPAPANPRVAMMLTATSAVKAYKRRADEENVCGGMVCLIDWSPGQLVTRSGGTRPNGQGGSTPSKEG